MGFGACRRRQDVHTRKSRDAASARRGQARAHSLSHLHQGRGRRDGRPPVPATRRMVNGGRRGAWRHSRDRSPNPRLEGLRAGAAAFRAGARNAGRHQDPDHPFLLPVYSRAISDRGGRAASVRCARRATAHELRDRLASASLNAPARGDEVLAAATAWLVTETSETGLQAVLSSAFGSDRRKLERFLAQRPEADRRTPSGRPWRASGRHRLRIVAESSGELERQEAQLRAIVAWLAGGTKADRAKSERLRAALTEASFGLTQVLSHTERCPSRQNLATKASRKPNRRSSRNWKIWRAILSMRKRASGGLCRSPCPCGAHTRAGLPRRLSKPRSGRAARSTMTI